MTKQSKNDVQTQTYVDQEQEYEKINSINSCLNLIKIVTDKQLDQSLPLQIKIQTQIDSQDKMWILNNTYLDQEDIVNMFKQNDKLIKELDYINTEINDLEIKQIQEKLTEIPINKSLQILLPLTQTTEKQINQGCFCIFIQVLQNNKRFAAFAIQINMQKQKINFLEALTKNCFLLLNQYSIYQKEEIIQPQFKIQPLKQVKTDLLPVDYKHLILQTDEQQKKTGELTNEDLRKAKLHLKIKEDNGQFVNACQDIVKSLSDLQIE